MTERCISEGRQWCKYCRMYISSNVNQILQHQSGRKHQYNEEEFIREVSLKVTSTPAGASAVANELLNRINELQNESATRGPKAVEPLPGPEANPAVQPVNEDTTTVNATSYPVSAHEAHGQWFAVPVAKAEDETNGVDVADDDQAAKAEEVAVEEKMEIGDSKVLRIGAVDEADDEEAAVRDAAKTAHGVGCGDGDDDASASDWDALEGKLRKKRTIRKKKRKRL